MKVSPFMMVREVLEHPQARKEIEFFINRYSVADRVNNQDGALNAQMIEMMFHEMPIKTLTVLYPELFSQADMDELMKRLQKYAVS